MCSRFLVMPVMFFTLCLSSYAAAPHVHGTAKMQIAIDGNKLEVVLVSPLKNLLGFERAPRNDKERKAVQKMKDHLSNPKAWLIPTIAAQCTAAAPEINASALDSKNNTVHNHGKHGEEHAELEAVVSFDCAAPAALNSMELRLFDAFPRLQRVQAEVAAPGKQSAKSLNGERRLLSW